MTSTFCPEIPLPPEQPAILNAMIVWGVCGEVPFSRSDWFADEASVIEFVRAAANWLIRYTVDDCRVRAEWWLPNGDRGLFEVEKKH